MTKIDVLTERRAQKRENEAGHAQYTTGTEEKPANGNPPIEDQIQAMQGYDPYKKGEQR